MWKDVSWNWWHAAAGRPDCILLMSQNLRGQNFPYSMLLRFCFCSCFFPFQPVPSTKTQRRIFACFLKNLLLLTQSVDCQSQVGLQQTTDHFCEAWMEKAQRLHPLLAGDWVTPMCPQDVCPAQVWPALGFWGLSKHICFCESWGMLTVGIFSTWTKCRILCTLFCPNGPAIWTHALAFLLTCPLSWVTILPSAKVCPWYPELLGLETDPQVYEFSYQVL